MGELIRVNLIKNLRREIDLKDQQILKHIALIKELKQKFVSFNARNHYFELDIRSKYKFQKKLKKAIKIINNSIREYNIIIKDLCLCVREEDEDEYVRMMIFNNYHSLICDTINIDQVIYIKDIYFFSYRKLGVIKNLLRAGIDPIRKIKERVRNINSEFTLYVTAKMIFCNIQEKVYYCLYRFLLNKNENELSLLQNKALKINFSADGTNVGRNLFIINFVFKFLNEEDLCKGVFGNYTVGLAECNEEYSELIEPFEFIMKFIRENRIFKFKGLEFIIDYSFTSDMKMMLIVNGLAGPTSEYPCQFCTCHKSCLQDLGYSIHRKLNDSEDEGARSLNQAAKFIKSNKKNQYQKGYKNFTLLTEIPFDKCIPDTLHARLRIVGRLVFLLVKELCAIDRYTGSDKIDLDQHKNLARFYRFLCVATKTRISLIPYNQNNEFGICKDLSGKYLLRMLRRMDILKLFPDIDNPVAVHYLWRTFYMIDRRLSMRSITPDELQTMTSEWLFTYRLVYPMTATPYIHVFTNHFHEFLRDGYDLALHTLQGLESLNNFTTIEYFQASNKHDDYLKQMMCRRLRIDRFKFQKDISELIAISDENTSSASDSDSDEDSEDINS